MGTQESFVQVAVDGAGKKIRNQQLYEQQADGTFAPVNQQVTVLADDKGNVVDSDLKPLLEELLLFSKRSALTLEAMAGISLSEDGDDGQIVAGYQGRSVLGVPAGPNSFLAAMADVFGRQVMLPWGSRDMYAVGFSGTITDTALHTLKSGEPGIYLDLVGLLITNPSASTAARADVSDGTNTYPFESVGGAGSVGFMGGGIIIPASKPGTDWTITMSTGVTDIRAFAVFVRNK